MSDQQSIAGLSPEEKRKLLAQLLIEKANQSTKVFPLAYGQRALWFIHQLAPESSAYHIAFTARVRSAVNVTALKRTFQHLVDRHAALRTTYQQREGELVQVVNAYQEVAFEQIDASSYTEEELYQLVVEAHKQPFDLVQGPVIRWQLFTQDETNHVLLITVHHIAFDGYSMFVLLNDLKVIYDAEASGQPIPPLSNDKPYTDFVTQQLNAMASPEGERLKTYWLNQLPSELPIINMPTDFPRPTVQTYNGAAHEFVIDADQTKRLKEFAAAEGVTLFVVLLAAFQTLLHRYSGQDELLIGTPTSNRNVTEFGKTVGYFVNPIVLYSHIEDDPTFRAYLGQVRKTVLDGLAHQEYPFVLLAEQLSADNDPSRSPIFQVMFNLQSLQRIETTSPLFKQDHSNPNTLLFERYLMQHEEGQFDFNLDVVEVGGTLLCAFKYNTDLYKASTVERWAGHYQTLLQAALANPDMQLSRLPFLTDAERHQLLVEWNDTAVDYPRDQYLHHDFEQHVKQTPNAAAVVFEDQVLTYDQLNQRANQLAHYLHQLGIGPDQKVGLYVERSLDMVVGLYGILKAGGAYVPLDPAYPADRIALMIEDSQAAVLLTQERLLSQQPTTNARVVCIDRDWGLIAQQPQTNPNSGVQPHHLAYTIYTSGSTGKPKGVMIEHRNAVNFFTGMDARVPHDPAGVWLAVTSISFDISVLELFWTLARGFKVILYAEKSAASSQDYTIEALIRRHGVTHFQCTPSMADMLTIDPDSAAALATVQTLMIGGEALPVALARKLVGLIQKDVLNMYGPTETTIWSSTYRVEQVEQSVPIGRPIANTTMYILDGDMQPVPIGLPGELYIGGEGVVRGYWNRPDLTAERFVPDPFNNQRPGARLYKTGDLARYLPDGNIEFLGRNDFQVKIRGHRIELGEIEAVLDQHPAVQKSVVIAREDTPGDKRLVAYLLGNNSPNDFRSYLRDKLPEFMIPAHYVTLEAFPLTPNGKMDRKALPAPHQSRPEVAPVQGSPTTEMEKLLAGIWEDVLAIDNVNLYDNFFDLGGHSLQVIRVVTQLESATGIKLDPVRMRFETLGQLAAFCETAANQPQAAPAETGLPKKFLSSMRRLVTGKSG